MFKKEINIPKAALYFIQNIKDKLNERKWNETSIGKEFIAVLTKEFPYSYEVIKPLERNFSKNGWEFRLYSYKRLTQSYTYVFRLEKKK